MIRRRKPTTRRTRKSAVVQDVGSVVLPAQMGMSTQLKAAAMESADFKTQAQAIIELLTK